MGDILHGKVWREAKMKLMEVDERAQKGYDIISCRPYNGWQAIFLPGIIEMGTDANAMQLYRSFIDRMTRLLHPSGGVLFVQHPQSLTQVHREDVEPVLREKMEGFEVTVGKSAARIIKKII